MTQPHDGGPAFPTLVAIGERALSKGGLTVRDYFAAKAMNGLILNVADMDMQTDSVAAAVADLSYRIADAMLAARGGQ